MEGTRCTLLPLFTGVIDPQLWFSKRCIKLINMALNSHNVIVSAIVNLDLNGMYSIMGGQWKHLRSKYGMEECNVMKRLDEKCKNECESVRVCDHIREMCSWRDRCHMTICVIRSNVAQLLNCYVHVHFVKCVVFPHL